MLSCARASRDIKYIINHSDRKLGVKKLCYEKFYKKIVRSIFEMGLLSVFFFILSLVLLPVYWSSDFEGSAMVIFLSAVGAITGFAVSLWQIRNEDVSKYAVGMSMIVMTILLYVVFSLGFERACCYSITMLYWIMIFVHALIVKIGDWIDLVK